jgi:FixJ family two-component response regulator
VVSKSQIVSIVDDDASVRAAMQSLLRSLGFVAFVFESAEDFLRSPRVDDSSCVITDVQMPGMSGLDLQDRLIAQGSRIPVILITAFPEQSIRSRAQAGGALGLLEKPFAGRALSRSPGIATFWAISVRLPDMQIIDFARVDRRTPGAVDK